MSASLRGGLVAVAGAVRQRPMAPGSLSKITASLGELKGIPMKLGQLMSYLDSSLPDEARAELSALQTHAQPLPPLRAARILRDELGAAAAPLLDSFDPRPIAAASIGQVHRARVPDGTEVAIKIQYPGIATAIENDLAPASLIARMISAIHPALGADRFLHEARARLLEECDYRAEARHHAELARRFAGHPVIAIPAVHPAYSTGRVLTTSFVDGVHLDDFLAGDPPQHLRERFGRALLDCYVGALLHWRVLPGDPHPGNYLFCADGRLAILDHGCTRTFDAASDRLVRVTLALEAETRAGVFEAIAALGGEALLVLRIRYGLAAVLARLGLRGRWRDLIATHGFDLSSTSQPGRPSWQSTEPQTDQRAGESPERVSGLDEQRESSDGTPRGKQPRGIDDAPVAPAPPAPPEPAPPTLEVVLVHGGLRTIEIVREVRDLFSLGISEAKQIIDDTPRVLARTRDRREAELLKQRLEDSGGTVEIRDNSQEHPIS